MDTASRVAVGDRVLVGRGKRAHRVVRLWHPFHAFHDAAEGGVDTACGFRYTFSAITGHWRGPTTDAPACRICAREVR